MSAWLAWRDGIRRVRRAPGVLAGVWMMSVFVSLPLAAAMRSQLAAHLGDSLAADKAADGVNYDWMQEFSGQATGLGATFGPSVIGFGAVIANLSAFVDNDRQEVVVIGAAGASLLLWTFFAGGIIDRYARDRATRAHGFFAVSGAFFFRFLRLAILAAIVYGVLFGAVHPWLFDGLFSRVTRDLTVERTAFFIRLVLYGAFGLALAVWNAVLDYAKVRAVVEDRRSMIGAVAAGLRFIRQNGRAVFGLYLLDATLFVLVLALYAAVAPGAGGSGWSMWISFAIGQAYIVGRLWAKLVFWASETSLFQGRLAHASYVAVPSITWPDSPAAEALGR